MIFGAITIPVYPVIENLPADHCHEIGLIVSRWAVVEWSLSQIIYGLLDVDPKQGRIAVGATRAVEQVTHIEDLLALKELSVSTNLRNLRKELETLARHRDRLAHGIWLQHPSTSVPILQITKGKWQPDPQRAPVKRLVEPQGAPLSAGQLSQFVDRINHVRTTILNISREIDGALVP